MSGCIPLPISSVINLVVGTYYVLTVIAKTVVISISVRCEVFSYDIVSAGGLIPVIFCIEFPEVFVVGMFMAVVPCANVAVTVVVCINVISLVFYVNAVITGNCVPVIGFILCPFLRECVLVIVVPKATVADTVVVSITVCFKVLTCNVVSAGNCIPVIILVVRPFSSKSVLVVVVPFANIAYAIVVFINVLFLVLRLDVAFADGLKIVVGSVVRVFVVEFVLTENVIAGFDVAFTVVIVISVDASYIHAALIALEIFVDISVLCAGNFGSANITLEVAIVIDVNRTGVVLET